MSPLLVAAGALVAVPPAGAVALVLGLRTRNARVVRLVTRVQRSSLNPRQLEVAGRRGARMSVLRHRGRRSGLERATPVGVREVDGGFVVLLPYGPGTDWVRNVRAARRAVLEHDGRRHDVHAPEVLPVADVAPRLGTGDRLVIAVFGIREALLLRPVAADALTPGGAG